MSLLLAGTVTVVKSAGAQSHPVHEIIYFVEGGGTVAVGDRKFEVRRGNILIIPPNVLHQRLAGEVCREFYFWSDEPIPFQGDAEEGGLLLSDDAEGTVLQLITVSCTHILQRGVGIIGRLLAQYVPHEVEIAGALYSVAYRIALSPYPLVHRCLGFVATKVTKIDEDIQTE